MKKFPLNVKKALPYLMVALLAAGAGAAWLYNAYLINNPVLTFSSNYTLNLIAPPNQAAIRSISAQAIYSTATVAAQSFTDGRVSTGSITVANTNNLLAVAATNQITIAATATILPAGATNFLVVLTTSSLTGKVITYNGNALVGGTNWAVVDTTTGTANNIKNAINRYSGVTATRTNSEVDLVASAGASGNNKTLAVNTSSITVGGSQFGGGHNNRLAGAILTINGHAFPQGGAWSVTDTSSGTATSVAAALNRITGIKAVAAGSVVYSTASASGTAGNSFTLASTQPSYMTVASANYTGGRNNAQVCVNGKCVVQGTEWIRVATATGTAKAISDAFVAKSSISSIISSTWSAAAVVSATSTATGSGVNYTLTTNAPASFTLSGATMTGGQAPAYNGGTVITIANHGFGTGLGVVLSTSTGVTAAPLVYGATYYVAKIDANSIALSSSSAQAQAGTYIGLSASSVTGPHTFTLSPQLVTGTAFLVWQGSNDCANFFNLNVSSITFATPYAAGNANWDFGTYNYKCIRAAFTGPTTGGVNLQVIVSGQ